MKTVFTTGEAAKICKVSQQTIIRCFDSGQLKGFRVPGSRFRRIPRDQLYQFMRDNGIPLDGELRVPVLLIADPGASWVQELVSQLNERNKLDVQCSAEAFEAGGLVSTLKPEVVLIDTALPGLTDTAVCQRLHTLNGKRHILCLCADEEKAAAFRQAGADEAATSTAGLAECILKQVEEA